MNMTTESLTFPQMALPREWSVADMRRHVGNVAPERIRLYPPPGMATEKDALEIQAREGRLCELVDGVLVEKDISSYESILAGLLLFWINAYLEEHPLGVALAPDGALRLRPGRMRIPDVSFIRWERFPERRLPNDGVFQTAPDLAVEILSAGNTQDEMEAKLDDYRRSGVRLIWYIDPARRIATIYDGQQPAEDIDDTGFLDGREVLPGFSLPLAKLLDRYERTV